MSQNFTSPPIDLVYEGEASLPDRISIAYRLKTIPSLSTIQFKGLVNDGTTVDLNSPVTFAGEGYYDNMMVDVKMSNIIAFYYVLTNPGEVEIYNTTLVTQNRIPVNPTIGV